VIGSAEALGDVESLPQAANMALASRTLTKLRLDEMFTELICFDN
jgi:hypothetical protein